MSQLQFMDQQRLHYLVQLLCRVLRVVPSRYYAWCQRIVTKVAPAWETAMRNVFDEHERRYGTRRLQVELRELGHRVGRHALRTALRRHGRQALQPKPCSPSLAAQALYAPHHRFDPRQAVRPQPATRPAQAHPGQPGVGQRYHLFTLGQ